MEAARRRLQEQYDAQAAKHKEEQAKVNLKNLFKHVWNKDCLFLINKDIFIFFNECFHSLKTQRWSA